MCGIGVNYAAKYSVFSTYRSFKKVALFERATGSKTPRQWLYLTAFRIQWPFCNSGDFSLQQTQINPGKLIFDLLQKQKMLQ